MWNYPKVVELICKNKSRLHLEHACMEFYTVYVHSRWNHAQICRYEYVPSRRIWLTQPQFAFTIGGMVTTGEEFILPVSFRTVRFPLIINDHEPSLPICKVLSKQQLANLYDRQFISK